VAEEEFDGTDMVFYLLGAGQRGAHKARKTLPQGVVEALDVVGFPCFFRDGFVAFRRNDTVVHVILVRVKRGEKLTEISHGIGVVLQRALIMASATPAAYFRGQNIQASDKYGIRGLWWPS